MSVIPQNITVDETFRDDPCGWLATKAKAHNLSYLLAHADDGVIWGWKNGNDQLITSGEVFNDVAVELRLHTLQQARLFGPEGELLLWFDGQNFSARFIADGKEKPDAAYEETHWLWGEGEESKDHFTLMHEGREGLRHAPPVEHAEGARIGMIVRHYLYYDSYGQAYVENSRHVNLTRVWEAKWH